MVTVLPPESALVCLPPLIADLMLSPASPIADFYQNAMSKGQLNFIDQDRLLSAVVPLEGLLPEDALSLNKGNEKAILMLHPTHHLTDYIATLMSENATEMNLTPSHTIFGAATILQHTNNPNYLRMQFQLSPTVPPSSMIFGVLKNAKPAPRVLKEDDDASSGRHDPTLKSLTCFKCGKVKTQCGEFRFVCVAVRCQNETFHPMINYLIVLSLVTMLETVLK